MKTEEREQKERIQNHICRFQTGDFMTNAESLFTTLGYASDRRVKIDKDYLCNKGLNQEKALFSDWREAGLLYQVTGEDLSNQGFLFEIKFDIDRMQSYLFYAIELEPKIYQRGKLAQITREVNKLFPMPVFILFKYGNRLTFSIIDRRQHKRDESKDVLEKVTLIKDISIANPHRAHIEILYDLSYPELLTNFRFSNFEGLHKAWQKTLDIDVLNNKFYKELYHWYLWASKMVKFPQIRAIEDMIDDKIHQSESLIRLLTRLLFCWFMKEKGLIQDELFRLSYLQTILKNFNGINSEDTIYYKAILQNLFFATLNKPVKDRELLRKEFPNPHYGDQLVYRYEELFNPDVDILKLFSEIPFLNGGLFDCLDQRKDENNPVEIRLDGFSSKPLKQPTVPDKLFFGEYKGIDLSNEYDDKKKSNVTIHGLIDIFNKYKFTIEENTPVEEEIALDPELLGKVFENLLASYNPETKISARKQTGSFFTPRAIVNYMVDESLVAYLDQQMKEHLSELKEMDSLNEVIREVLSYTEKSHPFSDKEITVLIQALDNIKILDPACGSGAFLMGMVHKMLHLLRKIDPENKLWFEKVIAKFPVIMQNEMRKKLEPENWDYIRKLGLIQECIYGIDIQPIAIQIAKLRFFISLLVDQKEKPGMENRGLEPLPNLDFKLVCANTLISPPESEAIKVGLFSAAKDDFSVQFERLTEQYFSAYLPGEKKKLKDDIANLINRKCQEKIGEIEKKTESDDEKTRQMLKERHKNVIGQKNREIALWNSYKNLFKHEAVGFFEAKYFFPKVTGGFDIVIANPPYVRADSPDLKAQRDAIMQSGRYETLYEKWDLFIPFIEQGLKLLSRSGFLSYITSNSLLTSKFAFRLLEYIQHNYDAQFIDYFTDDTKVFEAGVVPVVFGLSRQAVSQSVRKTIHHGKFNDVAQKEIIPLIDFKSLGRDAFRLSSNSFKPTIQTILLGDICYLSYGLRPNSDERYWQGEFTRDDLVSETKDATHPVPYVEGKNIGHYRIDKVLYLEWGTDRVPKKLVRPTFPELYDRPKILCGIMTGGTFDNAHIICNHSIVVLVRFAELKNIDNKSISGSLKKFNSIPRAELEAISTRFDLKYILAILNSKFANRFLNSIRRHRLENYFYPDDFRKLPIADISVKNQKPFIEIVDRILAAKRANPQADTFALEREIDQLVYELYGLTEEEIAVVEGKNV